MSINIIPKDLGVKIKSHYRERMLLVLISLGIIWSIATSIMLFPAVSLFTARLDSAEKQLAVLRDSAEQIEAEAAYAEMEMARDNIRLLKKPKAEAPSVLTALDILVEDVPKEVVVTQISVGSGNMEFRGSATDRNVLKEFGKKLEQDSRIEKVDSPLSNFIAEKGNQFLINITIRP